MRGKEEEEEEQGIGLRRKETGWASLTPSHHAHTLRTQTLDPNLLHHLTTHTHSVHLHCSLISNVAITLCPLRCPPPPPPPSSSSSFYCFSNCSFTAAALNKPSPPPPPRHILCPSLRLQGASSIYVYKYMYVCNSYTFTGISYTFTGTKKNRKIVCTGRFFKIPPKTRL